MTHLNSNTSDVSLSDMMLTADRYLDRLLVRYAGTFDIYTPYHLGGTTFPVKLKVISSVPIGSKPPLFL